MSKATNSKTTPSVNSQMDRDIEEYHARHKISVGIQQQLDRLDPKQFIYHTGIAIELQRKAVFDEEAAKFQRLADEQTKQSKAAQKEIDRMEENGEKQFNDAKEALLIRQTVAEASLLRAKSRIYPDLQKTLKGTKYEKAPAPHSDSEPDSDNDVPIPEKIPAPIYAVIRRKRALFGGLSRTEPSGSSSGIDAIDVDEDVAID